MEKLYNNIVLPDVWPPREPCGSVPPYIKNPPEVIRLDEHSQLFVDDFFIESTNLTSCFHEAEKKGRVFYPETKWEKDESLPVATPKSGGVWKVDGKYKVWYEAGWVNQMAYAESEDGIHFIRPKLDIERGTNKILTYDKDAKDEKYFRPDSTTVFYDPKDTDGKYKLFIRNVDLGLHAPAIVALSDDGIHFRDFTLTSPVGDRSTMFYNPFRKKWVYSIRDYWQGRSRSYRECDNLITGAKWEKDEVVKWMATDDDDAPNPYICERPQLYNVDAAAYESVMLGMFQIHYGPDNKVCLTTGAPKITELQPMFSRDGYHFTRIRKFIIKASFYEGAWDRGYIQSVGGVYTDEGDKLRIYYIGFSGDMSLITESELTSGMYSGGAMGYAEIRRDGFVSMNGKGTLLTKPLECDKPGELFINAKGTVKAEILTHDMQLVAQSDEFKGDSVSFKLNISAFGGDKPFRIRFTIDGEFYSFSVK